MSGSASIYTLFTPKELALEKQWLDIRDLFFGQNVKQQDRFLALSKAKNCAHPEAVYLFNVFSNHPMSALMDVKKIFENQPKDDYRAQCYYGLCAVWTFSLQDVACIRQAAKLGLPFAQARMANMSDESYDIRKKFAETAVAGKERDAFYWLGQETIISNVVYGRILVEIAAELGHTNAMYQTGLCFDISNPKRWIWWGKAAQNGISIPFLRGFRQIVDDSKSKHDCVFQIGKALSGHVNQSKGTIFENTTDFRILIDSANKAVGFYYFQLVKYRAAVDTWTLIGRRLKVVKDIRRVISDIIWSRREQGEY